MESTQLIIGIYVHDQLGSVNKDEHRLDWEVDEEFWEGAVAQVAAQGTISNPSSSSSCQYGLYLMSWIQDCGGKRIGCRGEKISRSFLLQDPQHAIFENPEESKHQNHKSLYLSGFVRMGIRWARY
jgi:hypothetical protein